METRKEDVTSHAQLGAQLHSGILISRLIWSRMGELTLAAAGDK